MSNKKTRGACSVHLFTSNSFDTKMPMLPLQHLSNDIVLTHLYYEVVIKLNVPKRYLHQFSVRRNALKCNFNVYYKLNITKDRHI